MSDYVRPSSPARVFVDDLGEPIRYGERWGAGSPPDDDVAVLVACSTASLINRASSVND